MLFCIGQKLASVAAHINLITGDEFSFSHSTCWHDIDMSILDVVILDAWIIHKKEPGKLDAPT